VDVDTKGVDTHHHHNQNDCDDFGDLEALDGGMVGGEELLNVSEEELLYVSVVVGGDLSVDAEAARAGSPR